MTIFFMCELVISGVAERGAETGYPTWIGDYGYPPISLAARDLPIRSKLAPIDTV